MIRRATARSVVVEIEAKPVPDEKEPAAERLARAQDLPMVKAAMEIFNADVVEVEEEADETMGG